MGNRNQISKWIPCHLCRFETRASAVFCVYFFIRLSELFDGMCCCEFAVSIVELVVLDFLGTFFLGLCVYSFDFVSICVWGYVYVNIVAEGLDENRSNEQTFVAEWCSRQPQLFAIIKHLLQCCVFRWSKPHFELLLFFSVRHKIKSNQSNLPIHIYITVRFSVHKQARASH